MNTSTTARSAAAALTAARTDVTATLAALTSALTATDADALTRALADATAAWDRAHAAAHPVADAATATALRDITDTVAALTPSGWQRHARAVADELRSWAGDAGDADALADATAARSALTVPVVSRHADGVRIVGAITMGPKRRRA